jgi:hypothetical protein
VLFIKYQSFNRSCAYAGLANMLLDLSVDTEDFKIVKAASIPYIFQFNEKQGRFVAGAMIQEKKWFDYYLNSIGLEFKEREIGIEEALNFFDVVSHKCMVGLKIGNTGKHAAIFNGIEKFQYKFLNNKRKESLEPDYYWYDSKALLMKLEDKTSISWIEKKENCFSMNIDHELDLSLECLENYRNKVKEFCFEEQDFITLEKAKGCLFEALFLDVFSMMEIVNNTEIVNEIKKIRNDYIQIMKLKTSTVLSRHLSIEHLDNVIIKYMKVIEAYKKSNLL